MVEGLWTPRQWPHFDKLSPDLSCMLRPTLGLLSLQVSRCRGKEEIHQLVDHVGHPRWPLVPRPHRRSSPKSLQILLLAEASLSPDDRLAVQQNCMDILPIVSEKRVCRGIRLEVGKHPIYQSCPLPTKRRETDAFFDPGRASCCKCMQLNPHHQGSLRVAVDCISLVMKSKSLVIDLLSGRIRT